MKSFVFPPTSLAILGLFVISPGLAKGIDVIMTLSAFTWLGLWVSNLKAQNCLLVRIESQRELTDTVTFAIPTFKDMKEVMSPPSSRVGCQSYLSLHGWVYPLGIYKTQNYPLVFIMFPLNKPVLVYNLTVGLLFSHTSQTLVSFGFTLQSNLKSRCQQLSGC